MPKIKTSAATPTRQSPRTKKARVEVDSSSADSAGSEDDEVLDLTESSDDDIQELKDYAVVKKSAKRAPAQTVQEQLSIFMANAAADLKAKQEAKKRQEDIQNFLNRPSQADKQQMYYQQVQARALQARALQAQALQNQAYLNQMHAAMNNARPNQAIRPKPASTVVDLTGQTSPTGINAATSAKTTASGNGSSQSGTVTSESKPKKIEPDSRRSSSSTTSGSGVGEGKMILEFETGYKCTRCLKLYESKSDLKRHIIKVHTDMLNFKCAKCGEVFSKQEKLDKHEMTHGRDKSYVCIKCEMSFYSMETLKRHEKVHEEKKEYKCSECGRAYNDMDKLVLHERVHQKNELPFQCEECDEGFRARGNLKMHIKKVHNAKGKRKR